MTTDYKFEGWLGRSPEAVQGKMEWGAFEPKRWTEDDVDIQITHCGVCGTDIHTLSSGWGPTVYPCCVGHEIVGKAVRVGRNVGHVKVGDRVGVGAQAYSCRQADCPECSSGRENYCQREFRATYGARYPGDEGITYGGYADYNRTKGYFVFKIPEGLPSEAAAPMLCAGVTVYSPLRRNGCGPGKAVGIVGVGGLGHFGILFAKALGADRVVGVSRKAGKRDDALALGADAYIATDDDEGWAVANKSTLDLIISTVSSAKMPLGSYLELLRPGGTYVQLGVADKGELPPFTTFSMVLKELKIGGSNIGSPGEVREMLEFAAEKGIRPWVQTRPLSEANQAIVDMEAGKAKYRYVLVNEKHL